MDSFWWLWLRLINVMCDALINLGRTKANRWQRHQLWCFPSVTERLVSCMIYVSCCSDVKPYNVAPKFSGLTRRLIHEVTLPRALALSWLYGVRACHRHPGLCVCVRQASEPDRPVTVGNWQNGGLRAGHAQPGGHHQKLPTGQSWRRRHSF